MNHTKNSSEVTLYTPFLLKFEGKMAQISKRGTLTTELHTSLSNLQRRDSKKLKSTMLSQKRADNILLTLNQIKNKNSHQMEEKTHYAESIKKQKQARKAESVRQFEKSVLISSFSIDFQNMLRQLDSIQFKKKKMK